MGEHPSALDNGRQELDHAALDLWIEANGLLREDVLGDPEHLARFLAWQQDFVAAVEEGLADIRGARTVSQEEMLAHSAERRRWFLEQRA